MKEKLLWLESHFEDTIEIILFIILLADVNFEVVRRYFLNASSLYSEEIAKYLLVAIVFLGVPYAIRHKRHIICDVIPSHTSQKVQCIITMISYTAFFVFCLLMVVSCYELVSQQIMVHKKTSAMRLPMWWFTSLVGIGFGLGMIRLIQAIIVDWLRYKKTGVIHSYSVSLD
ncbi:TRAP transporter small permease [Mailhella sp.]|uniref:TRAP transporter small permease n=1 Tax=Mailhella sp. TaxID=1981029 RepID=UPI003AB3F09E